MISKFQKNKTNSQSAFIAKLKNKKTIITLYVLFILLLFAIVIYFFRAYIFMTVAPKEYVAYSLSKTINQLDKETAILSKNILGFDIGKYTDFTLENSLDADTDLPYSKLKVSYAPSQSAMLINADDVNLYGEQVGTNILWNNDIIGIHIPQLTDKKHFCVSSKHFGQQVTTTKFTAVSTLLQKNNLVSDETDISFDNVIKQDDTEKKVNKKLKKQIKDESLKLIQTGKIKNKEMRKTFVGEKNTNAYHITMDFAGEDIKSYLNSIINIIENNGCSSKNLALYKNFLKNAVNKASFDYIMEVSLIIKSDKIVLAEMKAKKHNVYVLLSFDNVKAFLDGFHIKAKTNKTFFDITTSGNILPCKSTINYNIKIKSAEKYRSILLNLDFKTEKAQIIIDTQKGENINLKGYCRNKNAFEISVSSNDIKAKLVIYENANAQKLPGDEYMLLEKSAVSIGLDLVPIALQNQTARNIIERFTSNLIQK